jgi:amicyanin
MKDNKGLFAGIAGIVVVLVAGFIIMSNNSSKKSDSAMGGGTSMSKSSSDKMAASAASNAVATDAVMIKDYMFGPAAIKVKVGTKVTWTNVDTVRHNVVPDNETADFKAGPLIERNATYSYTFTKAGTYTYHCNPHPYMKGTVVVTE